MTRPHFPAVDPDTKLPSAAVQAAWAAGFVASYAAPKTALYLAGTGSGNEAAAIQAVLDAAGADEIVRLYGTFTTSSTITVKGNLDASGAVINYSGSGIAVQVGNSTVRSWKSITLPRVVCTNKPAAGSGWTAGTVGVKIINMQSCPRLVVPHVQDFEMGLLLFGDNQGLVYNNLFIGHLQNNKRNLGFDSTNSTGWQNQNTIVGGRFSHNPAEGTNISGCAHIWSGSNYGANNNTFVGCSLETAGPAEFQVDLEKGIYNQFINCRWEATSGTPKVRWGVQATLNRIVGGYDANQIVETRVSGSMRNIVDSSVGSRIFTGGSTAGVVGENTASNGGPVLTIVEAGTDAALADPTTAWRMLLCALDARFKATADAHPRVRIETTTGRMYVGTGSAAATAYIDGTSATVRIGSGSFIFGTDNTQDIGLAGANRPRYVRIGTAVQVGAFATGSRPAAATAGAAAMVFDTTLGKPIWSTGSAWVDATGTTV